MKEQYIIKVRFSPAFSELIEFDVELNPIPVDDFQGKDVIVNWKMLNGFDPAGKFWTDSNGLEMIQRQVTQIENESIPYHPSSKTISGNYYPVDSAIAIRDQSNNSNIQVTIMNDRAQGGSADLTDQATIELMQNRRILFDDDLGIEEPLNETESDDLGLRINALYYMHIFDYTKGKSI